MTNQPTIDSVMRQALEQALLAMKRIYQAGHDNIVAAGGSCDSPDYMMAGDPTARELRALLDGQSATCAKSQVPPSVEQQALVALPDGYCIMPKSLTAENGAKALLLGEFKVTVTNECPECAELDDPDEYCEICDGEGQYSQSHTISWDQIKFIYSKAVAGLRLRTHADPLTFQFRHRSTNELRSVCVTRAEVAEDMADTLFEKLVSQFCECEPVGETNEVECRCDEHGDEFELVADADSVGQSAPLAAGRL
ncbi:hypothetical protein [Pseudomonas sp. TWP3-2]|uniref:hypothetical protein n=1 Tax=Pseudomonas sp. TWP3-2 TaxID=2804574 RepID=UPI003CE7BF1F